jgi:hypothetical protein
MLMPENGASTVMKVATRTATTAPVKRERRCWFETESTTSISTNEMVASAVKATTSPVGPGAVAM